MSGWDADYDAPTSDTLVGESSTFGRAAGAMDQDDDVPMAGPSTTKATYEPDFDLIDHTPLEQFTRHWMNERHAPDLLPRQEILLSTLLDHIHRQSETISLLRGDAKTSEDEHIRIMLAQTEIERVKFMVNSYTRTRLYKIEKFSRFIVTSEEMQSRLTAAELNHASRFAQMTDRHYYFSVLQSLPESQAHLDDTPIFMPPMVTQPDKTKPVFAHALRSCPPIRLPDGASLEMPKDHISLLPYHIVEDLLLRGQVELV